MQEWFKVNLKKIGIYFPILLFYITFSYALDNCKDSIYVEDSPCLLILPVTINTNCVTLNVSVYNESTLLYSTSLSNYSVYQCSATFNQSLTGTYVGKYSSGDTFNITISQGYVRFYVYICLVLIIIFFLIFGYIFENDMMLYFVGFLTTVMAIDVYFNGFPNVSDTFMTNCISIILAGMGFYYLILPLLLFLKKVKF